MISEEAGPLAIRVRTLRKARRLTQTELAERGDFPQSSAPHRDGLTAQHQPGDPQIARAGARGDRR